MQPTEVPPADLKLGRDALLGGWSTGAEPNLVMTRARGAKIWDADDNEYLDLTSQAWSNNIGASDPRVVEAAHRQAAELSHVRSNYDSVPLLLMAKRMAEIAPGDLNRVAFCLHGSLAMESAIKLALKNADVPGPIIVLHDSYHGRSLTTMGLSWPHTERRFDPMLPSVIRVRQPYAYRAPAGVKPEDVASMCADELRAAIRANHSHKPAAFVMEPIQGNGTQLDFPPEYYRYVREICDEEGVLLIFDEIQTGFGRTGQMWAAEHYGVTPDLLVFGKGAGGGFPLAGVLARDGLEGFSPGDDALTFGEFPVSLAAGLSTLDVIDSDDLLQNCAEIGQYTTAALRDMQSRHPLIGDVRGPGLLIGVELVRDQATKEPATQEAVEIYAKGLERGVIFGTTRYAGLGNVVKFKPPLSITRGEIDRALRVFEDLVGAIERRS